MARSESSIAERRQIAYLIGMPRAGTTSLYHHLGTHPQLVVPFRRKTNYFDLHFAKSSSWFLSHFKGLREGQIGVDTLTLYFLNRSMPSLERLQRFNSDAKAILVVRKPAQFMRSMYAQIATFDSKLPPFEDFLAGSYVLEEDGHCIPVSVQDGDIAARIEEARVRFHDRLLIINFELFEFDLLNVLREIEAFLGITSHFSAANVRSEKINSHVRRNFISLQRMLRSTIVIATLRTLPRQFVVFGRSVFDRLSISRTPGRARTDDLLGAISPRFPTDDAYISRLFERENIVRT